MGEKRGNTAKKIYDFNTAGVLEVSIKGKWYRVTSNEFRSFDGKRRITEPVKQPGLGESLFNVSTRTYEYNGPVYISLSNQEVEKLGTETIVTGLEVKAKQQSVENSSRI